MIPSLGELISWNTTPRVHPNGFIQIDKPGTEGRERIHIWPTQNLPKQGSFHPIHDHIFDMKSDVLKGVMINKLYDFELNAYGNYELHQAQYKTPHDSTLLPTGKIGRLFLTSELEIPAGCTYRMPANVLHESFVTVRPTITLMTKVAVHGPHKPYVAIPIGIKPDNNYDRHTLSPWQLWTIVEESL